MIWKDITGYSRDDKERIQKWWSTKAGTLVISVGNSHIYYPDGKTWLLDCEPWFRVHPLKAKNIDEAKSEAISLIKKHLESALNALK